MFVKHAKKAYAVVYYFWGWFLFRLFQHQISGISWTTLNNVEHLSSKSTQSWKATPASLLKLLDKHTVTYSILYSFIHQGLKYILWSPHTGARMSSLLLSKISLQYILLPLITLTQWLSKVGFVLSLRPLTICLYCSYFEVNFVHVNVIFICSFSTALWFLWFLASFSCPMCYLVHTFHLPCFQMYWVVLCFSAPILTPLSSEWSSGVSHHFTIKFITNCIFLYHAYSSSVLIDYAILILHGTVDGVSSCLVPHYYLDCVLESSDLTNAIPNMVWILSC